MVLLSCWEGIDVHPDVSFDIRAKRSDVYILVQQSDIVPCFEVFAFHKFTALRSIRNILETRLSGN